MRRLVFLAALLAACSDPAGPPSPYTLDDTLRLNHVQAKGTHNSYHVQPAKPVSDAHRYTHAALDTQLDQQGVRQLELDLHFRKDKGFEVFHLLGIDPQSTCKRLVDCLTQVKRWSDANRWHLPLLIWLEPKDELDGVDPTLLPITGRYDALEAEIRAVFPAERILTPDEVRGAHEDLPTAIAADGWPTLGELRGRVIFALLDSGSHRQAYTAGAANLEGKLLFVDASKPSDPYAAMFKVNNAQSGAAEVRQLVRAGFIVTSNVDGVEADAAANSSRLAASLAAGIHYGSSDFPAPVKGASYWFELPGGSPARCNPVYTAAGCLAAEIEDLP